jgi:hypothetical protein
MKRGWMLQPRFFLPIIPEFDEENLFYWDIFLAGLFLR